MGYYHLVGVLKFMPNVITCIGNYLSEKIFAENVNTGKLPTSECNQ